ncbi:MAG: phosphatidylserine decarboxylase family protein [Nitrospirae bacterium]|nr:MAG: phosphatidylserine decarboxylase family protein [Nitrospirota bacterium]
MDRARSWPVAREGVPILAATTAAGVATIALGWWAMTAVVGLVTLFTAWFFRNPARHIPEGDNLIVSPGDGRVLTVVQEQEPRYLKERAVRVSIFLNPLNVHINRTPCAGKVSAIGHFPGKFMVASRAGATLENEQTAVLIETEDGHRVLCVQVAGYVARRIICWLTEGERVARGERYGLIQFGSRMDLYLPVTTHLKVRPGDHVCGGESVIGVFA